MTNEQCEKHVIAAQPTSGIILNFFNQIVAKHEVGHITVLCDWIFCNLKWFYFRMSYRILNGSFSCSHKSSLLLSSEGCILVGKTKDTCITLELMGIMFL